MEKSMTRESGFAIGFQMDVNLDVGDGVASANTTLDELLKIKFSSSSQSSEYTQAFKKNNYMMSLATATCLDYKVSVSPYNLPRFTNVFLGYLRDMQNANNLSEDVQNKLYSDFIDDFGTHYISEARLGAKLMIEKLFRKTETTKQELQTEKSCNGLDISTDAIAASAKHKSDKCKQHEKDQKNGKSNSFERETVKSVGSSTFGGDLKG